MKIKKTILFYILKEKIIFKINYFKLFQISSIIICKINSIQKKYSLSNKLTYGALLNL